MQVSFRISVFFQSRVAGSDGGSKFNFSRNLQTLFLSGYCNSANRTRGPPALHVLASAPLLIC